VVPSPRERTPLRLQAWEALLGPCGAYCPTPALQVAAQRALRAIRHGAHLRFVGDKSLLPRRAPNLPTTPAAKLAIAADIAKEVTAGRIAGPFNTPPLPDLVISPVGAVPKKGGDGWRRIHHLSWPRHSPALRSVNAGITIDKYSYATIDDAYAMIARLGRGCLLNKFDVKAAFRLIPVAHNDLHLLGFKFDHRYYVDLFLPFGLKSSPPLWEDFARLIKFLIQTRLSIKEIIQFVDDFLFGTAPSQGKHRVAAARMEAIAALLRLLGVPEALEKRHDGDTTAVFVGVELDTALFEARLPADKVAELRALLQLWVDRPRASVQDLRVLTGKLHWASKVVRAGRTFVRRILDLLRTALRSRMTSISISTDTQLDLRWWLNFLDTWNGVSIIRDPCWPAQATLYVDASGVGIGAWFAPAWFSAPPPEPLLSLANSAESRPADASAATIRSTLYELYAAATALATWAARLRGTNVTVFSDNEGAVSLSAKGSSRSADLMHIYRAMLFTAAQHDFSFRLVHLPGVTNVLADHLSRLQVDAFMARVPTASAEPSPLIIPPLFRW
jgi:hypothetical protein